MSALNWLLRVVVAAVFAWAAVTKIGDPASFLTAIRTFHALPDLGAVLLALWLPWAELVGGGAIFWPRHRSAALWALLALTIVFLGALGQAWLRGLDINCGCFGGAASVRGAGYLPYFVRDLALGAVLGWLLWQERRPMGLSQGDAPVGQA